MNDSHTLDEVGGYASSVLQPHHSEFLSCTSSHPVRHLVDSAQERTMPALYTRDYNLFPFRHLLIRLVHNVPLNIRAQRTIVFAQEKIGRHDKISRVRHWGQICVKDKRFEHRRPSLRLVDRHIMLEEFHRTRRFARDSVCELVPVTTRCFMERHGRRDLVSCPARGPLHGRFARRNEQA